MSKYIFSTIFFLFIIFNYSKFILYQFSSNQPQAYGNQYDTSALRSSGTAYRDERMGNEILARAGPSHQYQHPEYRTHEGMKTKNIFYVVK